MLPIPIVYLLFVEDADLLCEDVFLNLPEHFQNYRWKLKVKDRTFVLLLRCELSCAHYWLKISLRTVYRNLQHKP
uniref:Uncharacterized protein n=1 Tax=Anopheles quadriannulatus TaxID=34691 RepID=A0A182XU50_ANOQN